MRFHIFKWIYSRFVIWRLQILHMCAMGVTLPTMYLIKFYKVRHVLQFLVIWPFILHLKCIQDYVLVFCKTYSEGPWKHFSCEDCEFWRLCDRWVFFHLGVWLVFFIFSLFLGLWYVNHVVDTCIAWLCMKSFLGYHSSWFFNKKSLWFSTSINIDMGLDDFLWRMFQYCWANTILAAWNVDRFLSIISALSIGHHTKIVKMPSYTY